MLHAGRAQVVPIHRRLVVTSTCNYTTCSTHHIKPRLQGQGHHASRPPHAQPCLGDRAQRLPAASHSLAAAYAHADRQPILYLIRQALSWQCQQHARVCAIKRSRQKQRA